jgi:hypothetical protein
MYGLLQLGSRLVLAKEAQMVWFAYLLSLFATAMALVACAKAWKEEWTEVIAFTIAFVVWGGLALVMHALS